jgi:hypothetical protein
MDGKPLGGQVQLLDSAAKRENLLLTLLRLCRRDEQTRYEQRSESKPKRPRLTDFSSHGDAFHLALLSSGA